MIIDRSIHDESHTPFIIDKIGRKILFCLSNVKTAIEHFWFLVIFF